MSSLKKCHIKSTKSKNNQNESSICSNNMVNIESVKKCNKDHSKHIRMSRSKVEVDEKRKLAVITTSVPVNKDERKHGMKKETYVSTFLGDKMHEVLPAIDSKHSFDFVKDIQQQSFVEQANSQRITHGFHISKTADYANYKTEKSSVNTSHQSISNPIIVPGNTCRFPRLTPIIDKQSPRLQCHNQVFLPPISGAMDTLEEDSSEDGSEKPYFVGINVTTGNHSVISFDLENQDDAISQLKVIDVVDNNPHFTICSPTILESTRELVERQSFEQAYCSNRIPVSTTKLISKFEEANPFICKRTKRQTSIVQIIPSLINTNSVQLIKIIDAMSSKLVHIPSTYMFHEKKEDKPIIKMFDSQPVRSIKTSNLEGDYQQEDKFAEKNQTTPNYASHQFFNSYSDSTNSTLGRLMSNTTGESRNSFLTALTAGQMNVGNMFSKVTKYQKTTSHSTQDSPYCTVRPRVRYKRAKRLCHVAANKYLRILGIQNYCPIPNNNIIYPAVMGRDKILYKLEGPAAEHKTNSAPPHKGNTRYAYPLIPRKSDVLKNFYMLETAGFMGPTQFSQGAICMIEKTHQEDASIMSDEITTNRNLSEGKGLLITETGVGVDDYLAKSALGTDYACPMLRIQSSDIQNALKDVDTSKTLAGFMVYSTKDNGISPTAYDPKGGRNCKLVPLYLEKEQHNTGNCYIGQTLFDESKQYLETFTSDEQNVPDSKSHD